VMKMQLSKVLFILQEESSLIFGWRLLWFEIRFKIIQIKSVRWKRDGIFYNHLNLRFLSQTTSLTTSRRSSSFIIVTILLFPWLNSSRIQKNSTQHSVLPFNTIFSITVHTVPQIFSGILNVYLVHSRLQFVNLNNLL
jgi:hypothetical protein